MVLQLCKKRRCDPESAADLFFIVDLPRLARGNVAMLLKPYDAETLLETIARVRQR